MSDERMIAQEEIEKAVKAFDDLYATFKEHVDLYHAQLRFLSTGTSMGLDADLARVSRVIIGIRRDLENARHEGRP